MIDAPNSEMGKH